MTNQLDLEHLLRTTNVDDRQQRYAFVDYLIKYLQDEKALHHTDREYTFPIAHGVAWTRLYRLFTTYSDFMHVLSIRLHEIAPCDIRCEIGLRQDKEAKGVLYIRTSSIVEEQSLD